MFEKIKDAYLKKHTMEKVRTYYQEHNMDVESVDRKTLQEINMKLDRITFNLDKENSSLKNELGKVKKELHETQEENEMLVDEKSEVDVKLDRAEMENVRMNEHIINLDVENGSLMDKLINYEKQNDEQEIMEKLSEVKYQVRVPEREFGMER